MADKKIKTRNGENWDVLPDGEYYLNMRATTSSDGYHNRREFLFLTEEKLEKCPSYSAGGTVSYFSPAIARYQIKNGKLKKIRSK